MSNAARIAQQQWNNFTSDKAMAAMEFDRHWKEEKQRRKDNLAEAIKACYAKNMTVPEVSAETGNANHNFLYQLRAEYKAGQTRQVQYITEEDIDIDVDWLYHDHTGVHGWLVDRYVDYVKVHGTPGTEWEGEYAIFDNTVDEPKQIAGNTAFGATITDKEYTKRTKMLVDLLDDNYTGRIVERPNPFTS